MKKNLKKKRKGKLPLKGIYKKYIVVSSTFLTACFLFILFLTVTHNIKNLAHVLGATTTYGTCGTTNAWTCTGINPGTANTAYTTAVPTTACAYNATKAGAAMGTTVFCCTTGSATKTNGISWGNCGSTGQYRCESSCPAANISYSDKVPTTSCAYNATRASVAKGTSVYCECGKGNEASCPSTNTTVVVNTATPGKPVPSRFAGISVETSMLCTMLSLDSQSSIYSQLFKTLGNETLRIGGNSGDQASWMPDATSCSSNSIITKTLINSVISFAKKIGWNVTWGVNLVNNNASSAAAETTYLLNQGVTSTGGNQVYAIAIGNEPDQYYKNGDRPATYTFNEFKSEWENYRTTILTQRPNVQFMGSDSCCSLSWMKSFLNDEHALIFLGSVHYYPTSVTGTGYRSPTVANLLSQGLAASEAATIQTWIGYGTGVGVPVAIMETNSTSGGGMSGVSNTFASTLWGLDYLLSAEELGIQKVEFHAGGAGTTYAPIDATGAVKPLYYALLAYKYAAAANGTAIIPSINTNNINVTAHAIVGADNSTRVILLNKDLTQTATIRLHTTKSYTSAALLRLSAPSATAFSGVTFAGNAVANDGTWTPGTTESIPLVDPTDANITLLPTSAAVVVLR